MTDKKKMPVSGGGPEKGMPDGVSGSPVTGEKGRVNGRVGGGESGGGAYPNPHSGKAPSNSGFLGHGGQNEIEYHGGSNPNATTGGETSRNEERVDDRSKPVRKPHEVRAGRQAFTVVEDSGVAAAEATGKVATDAPYKREQETPGGG